MLECAHEVVVPGGTGSRGLVLSCEHAARAVPSSVWLGVADADLASHIAWDEGAALVARGLAALLGAPLVLGGVSRLVVDLNRSPEAPGVIPARTWGVDLPGNAQLSTSERAARLATWHAPYRAAVAAQVAAQAARGACLHLSVHSFTPELEPAERAFDVGVLYNPARWPEATLAEGLLASLGAQGLDARANAPYPGTDDGMTTWLRGVWPAAAYSGIEIEWSHAALLAHGADALAGRLAAAVRQVWSGAAG